MILRNWLGIFGRAFTAAVDFPGVMLGRGQLSPRLTRIISLVIWILGAAVIYAGVVLQMVSFTIATAILTVGGVAVYGLCLWVEFTDPMIPINPGLDVKVFIVDLISSAIAGVAMTLSIPGILLVEGWEKTFLVKLTEKVQSRILVIAGIVCFIFTMVVPGIDALVFKNELSLHTIRIVVTIFVSVSLVFGVYIYKSER